MSDIDNDIDFRALFIQFVIRLSLIIIMVIILYFCGNAEIIRWFNSYDTRDSGSVIMLIAILMFIACFFDTTQPFFSVKPFNISCSLAIYAFGYGLNHKGISSAVFFVGVVSFIIAYLAAPLSMKIASRTFRIGLCCIVISWLPLPNHPTGISSQPNRAIDIVTEWQTEIVTEHFDSTELPLNEHLSQIKGLKHPVSDFTPYAIGTEESITKNAKDLLKQYIALNPSLDLKSIRIRCMNLPQSYTDQYGFPEVYFYKKYINADGTITLANIR